MPGALAFPVVFHAGPMHVSAHFIFESLAYAAGFAWYRHLRRLSGDFLAAPDRVTVIAAAIVGAALGSKILFWFEDPGLTWNRIFDLGYLLGGKTIVGGLLGGTIAVEWIKHRSKITRRTGDLFALPMTMAIAIGRIGCFLAGLPDHTYGISTTLPWGVDFGDGIPRHPTQLYEILFLTCLALCLAYVGRRRHREGDLYRIFLISYLAFRTAVDFLKPGVRFGGLTVIQWVAVTAILSYWRDIVYFLVPGKYSRTWAAESDRTCSTTPPSPSAHSATAAATPK